jgi:hypothetical protein
MSAGWRRRTPRRWGGISATTALKAYSEERQGQRDVILLDGTTHAGRTPAHWRRVALIVARMTGKKVGLDTATRMLEPGWNYENGRRGDSAAVSFLWGPEESGLR